MNIEDLKRQLNTMPDKQMSVDWDFDEKVSESREFDYMVGEYVVSFDYTYFASVEGGNQLSNDPTEEGVLIEDYEVSNLVITDEDGEDVAGNLLIADYIDFCDFLGAKVLIS